MGVLPTTKIICKNICEGEFHFSVNFGGNISSTPGEMASATAHALVAFSDKVQIPTQHNSVFNEECLFSFDGPESPDGLYVCMEKFIGLGKEHVAAYHNRTSNAIFLHRKVLGQSF